MPPFLSREAQRVRYGKKSQKTIVRWGENPALGMPEEIDINGRKYRDEEKLIRWEQSRVAKTADPVK
jgi:hypothetical protein